MKRAIVFALALAASGCASLPSGLSLPPEVSAKCKADPQGCAIIPINDLGRLLEDVYEKGRDAGGMRL